MWTEAELAYLAGLIDGEGSIGVYCYPLKANVVFPIRLVVAGTNERLPIWLSERFDGHIYWASPKVHARNIMARKRAWSWRLRGPEIEKILPAVLPYLVVKKEQANLMLEFIGLKTRHGYFMSDQNLSRRYEIVRRFSELNDGVQRKHAIPLGVAP